MGRTRSAGKVVKINIDAVEGLFYQSMIAVHNDFGRNSFSISLNGDGRAVFVSAADVNYVFMMQPQKSYEDNFPELNDLLNKIGAGDIVPVIIDEDMSSQGQWKWFEEILSRIEHGDALTVDLTHGYRAVPIVFSTAINFLQKARNVTIDAVYYGAFDKDRKLAPIVDMKEFYIINEWAEAVGRLVEDADTRKLTALADGAMDFQLGELDDKAIIDSFEKLTNTVRNIEINHVGKRANEALRLIREKEKSASVTGKILLGLVIDKFTTLTTEEPGNGTYDKNYFLLQIEIIRFLLEHKLFMQAYTVMREFIGSIGMVEVPKARVDNKKGRDKRQMYAEVFVNMIRFPKRKWNFEGKEKYKDALLPYYEKLESIGAVEELQKYSGLLIDYRNGFDHAWTIKSEAPKDIAEKGKEIRVSLEKAVRIMATNKILT